MAGGVTIAILVVLTVVAGVICGFVALHRVLRLEQGARQLEREFRALQRELRALTSLQPPAQPSRADEETEAVAASGSVEATSMPVAPVQARVPSVDELTPVRPARAEAPAVTPVLQSGPTEPAFASSTQSGLPGFEVLLGTKGIWWVGIAMSLVGLALLLKFAYDNNYIGPQGRLAIGVLAGCAALGIGERFRRRDWRLPFEVMTGGGIAAFYICVYFSFQVYHLSTSGLSMGLAVVVTLFAVAMAVGHDAVAIAILGVAGGFLSPVLLSTGENHPYGLFTYIAILDLVALGAAYFRRWRALDALCFVATAVLYQAWYAKFYASDQLTPALLFTTVFYLLFLLVPTLHGLVRRLPEQYEGLALVIANAVFSLFCYYTLLFHAHRTALGFVVLGQALVVAFLFEAAGRRIGRHSQSAQSFLAISLALVTLAVPIQLRLYGIPVAWAMEAALFAWLGVRMGQLMGRLAAIAAAALAAAGLLYRLPLHTAHFTPVINAPFGSWLAVIAGILIAAAILRGNRKPAHPLEPNVAPALALLAIALGCALPSLEMWDFWRFAGVQYWRTHAFSSLVVLWALIPVATAVAIQRLKLALFVPLVWTTYGVGVLLFLFAMQYHRSAAPWLLFNPAFLPRLAIILSLWWVSRPWRLDQPRAAAQALELVGHGLLTVLLAVELDQWGMHTTRVSSRMATSLISAAWAVQAFSLIWLGLATRKQPIRIAGFVLFALTVGKVLFLDTSQLDKPYRIVSWLATGILLLAAGYFYQRYLSVLLKDAPKREDS